MTIVEQFRECFKDVPVGTRFTRQQIIDKLRDKYGTNETSIIPSDHSYNMTNKGLRGANRENNFFLNVGEGEYEYVGENFTGMAFSDVIEKYKQNFSWLNNDERYKWVAVAWYKDHWNIDAPDFARMLSVAFSKQGNLLMAQMYFPYKMACEYAEEHPEDVRALFRQLYDESAPLAQRYKAFRAGFNDYIMEKKEKDPDKYKNRGLNHYQDLHAVSVYLAFEYPDKYCIYKSSMYEGCRNLVGFAEDRGKARSEVWKLENCNHLSDAIIEAIKQDPEVIQMSRSRLGEDCYQDENYRLLSADIMRYGWILEEERKKTNKNQPQTEMETEQETESLEEEQGMTDIDKNTILYGPPGTGKTYSTAIYAVAAIEKKPLQSVKAEAYDNVLSRFNQYKEQGRIVSTTFHQSYGYEEFVEGIKPVMDTDEENRGDVQYEISSGSFKQFCERAAYPVAKEVPDYGLNRQPSIWKVSLGGTYANPTRTECMENNHIRIGWDVYGPEIGDDTVYSEGGKFVLKAFISSMKIGDVVLSCYTSTTIDAIGVVTGDYEWHDNYDHYKRVRNVNWLVKGIQEDITEINNGATMTLSSVYKLSVSLADVMKIVTKYRTEDTTKRSDDNFVFIIDEINRGNISKIFGELITLIEPSKRMGQKEGMTVKLPYSQHLFGVPDNVYLIGTMNTADRSIATIDTALRRRFRFVEMQPDPDVLEGISVEDISIKDLLIRMNRKIAVLYDREHTIGHAYFMPLKTSPTIETLSMIFSRNILPLLQEYFYEDYEKIRLVLGDNNKDAKDEQFILVNDEDYSDLFGNTDYDFEDSRTYSVNPDAFGNIEAYRSI